ncbi:dihydrolipoamide acetyltransferase family protein [Mesobacillus maritimus]|uniref:Dihydrolipoamide acetyltransferase component of pyruvate dehydrogenase complex n=1 Tax=Mesobacillus maritimus TaxID=1643336 RepID=A0ABS7KB05_9BACI|nr:dihydrolipoamide acetyltransferase family protein [Mesobacillus maritimus]MBY0099437.1 2-oxo acid dehydrogenase subunit E2 [Mesobacillus maritimus]
MVSELKIPKIGVEMQSAVIDEWDIDDGSQVEKGEILLKIQTEKVTYEIESPDTGYVKILGKEGDEYDVGSVVAVIAESQEQLERYQQPNNGVPQEKNQERYHEENHSIEQENTLSKLEQEIRKKNRKVKATPLAKKIAKGMGIDLTTLSGTGPGGAIIKRDVFKAQENASTTKQEESGTAALQTHSETELDKLVAKRSPLKGIRKTIATHMMASLQTSAQLTDINEIEVSKLVKFRKELNEDLASHLGFTISFNHLFIKAVSIILKELPIMNSSIIEEEVVQWKSVNLGFALSVEGGLVVPVIKNVDQLSLNEIATKFNDLVARGKAGILTADDLSGGTFTITNIGSYGGYISTPIINQPQVAILGLGQIKEKPIVNENREITVGDLIGYSLTFDHRLIDGATAGEFQNKFAHIMRNPKLLLVK